MDGVFDLFHPGHLRYLKAAKKFGDVLIVSITEDQFIHKGPGRPVYNSSDRLKCFIQVNIAEEKQKRGIMVNEINELVARCRKSEVVEIKGLMTIPPLSNNEENSREFFQKLKFLADQQELKSLSMGMTNDYRIAIEEGATHLRIGRKIFANNTVAS